MSDHNESWYKSTEIPEDTEIRPQTLDGFIGQAQLKKNLKLFMQAAKQRNEALDHVFFSGGPGLGKTTLANIIAYELGVDIRITNAPIIEKPKDLIGILSTLTPHSVLFIDEIHRLKPVVEEILYVAMEDYILDWIIGTGPDARTVRIPINKFTLVGATTQPGKVSAPLHGRFGIRERIDNYEVADLQAIIVRTVSVFNMNIETDAAAYVARMSRGTPRYANRLVKRIRDFAQVQGSDIINIEIAKKSMRELGIDELGLEALDKRILEVLIKDYKGKPVGLKTLSIAVQEPPESLEDFWEEYLIRQGLLQRTPQGRIATEKAWSIFGEQTSRSPSSLF